MKLTTRIAQEEIRDQAASLTGAIMSQHADINKEYLVALILEEMARAMNHAFSAGRIYERKNPTP